jgi:histidinol-phosphate aminotransferase
VFVGNGSDECLALAVRAFVEPASSGALRSRVDRRTVVQYFRPSYSLYPVLADTHGAVRNEVPLGEGFALPDAATLRGTRRWRFDAALSFVTTPNAPSGRGYSRRELAELCRVQRGVTVLDEAYVDFAAGHALPLALEFPHVLVARTFSKAYSLCFQRIGYMVGHADLIAALDAVRDSYNVNGLGQVAAEATLGDLAYYRANFKKVVRTRDTLTHALTALGFHVLPSQTNFFLARPPRMAARTWLRELRAHRILVRWFDSVDLRDYLRITVGTDREITALVAAARRILSRRPPGRARR